jgi:hypothetical protein
MNRKTRYRRRRRLQAALVRVVEVLLTNRADGIQPDTKSATMAVETIRQLLPFIYDAGLDTLASWNMDAEPDLSPSLTSLTSSTCLMPATRKAERSGKGTDHQAASEAHRKAAVFYHRGGDKESALSHRAKSGYHDRFSKRGRRTRNAADLTTNVAADAVRLSLVANREETPAAHISAMIAHEAAATLGNPHHATMAHFHRAFAANPVRQSPLGKAFVADRLTQMFRAPAPQPHHSAVSNVLQPQQVPLWSGVELVWNVEDEADSALPLPTMNFAELSRQQYIANHQGMAPVHNAAPAYRWWEHDEAPLPLPGSGGY